MNRDAPPEYVEHTSIRWFVIGIVVLGLSIWVLAAQGGVHEHITECGVDARGPYAKVRVDSVGGGLGSTNHRQVKVEFRYDGAWYGVDITTVKLPVIGFPTTVVRGAYPPRVIHLSWEHPGQKDKIIVEGRTVHRQYNRDGELLTERVKPDDLQRLSCEVGPNEN